MKRRMLSLLLCGALCLTGLLCAPASAASAFQDISDETTAVAAAVLQGMGVVSGTGGNDFEPNASLTRAQLCTMVVNALGLSSQVSTYARKTLFSDVSSSSWYNGYVNLAYSQGLINGYGNGTFGPNDPVTYGQASAILLRMLGYTTSEIGTVWPLDYTAFADSLGLSEGLSLDAYDTLTRGEAAILLYRTMKAQVNGTSQYCYETVSGVTSTQQVILLDTDASYGGTSGLLMAYSLDGTDNGVVYYSQKNSQSEALESYMGTLLFDSSGQVVGFLPEDGGWQDVTVASASASGFTASDGTSCRVSSDTVVVSGGVVYPYTTTGYLQLESGKSVRLYYADDGSILCLYLAGGTVSTSETAVATAASAGSIARQLGVSDKNYSVTKNGVEASASDVAQYDVGYYDAASNTLRVSDYRVTGYLSDAEPNVAAAETITVAGCTFEVLESAWDSMASLKLGNKVTLLLTDDGKVAAVYLATALSADMIGVLSEDGRSVTLSGSGVTLSASTMDYDEKALGSLVSVSATSASTLRCTLVSGTTPDSALNLTAETLGDLELAPSFAVYEWTGSGYVYDLEGSQGASSSDFSAITWTSTVAASSISYYHTNSAGQVDILLLNNVTGNSYTYGRISLYTGENGIDLGTSSMSAYNTAATVTNGNGTSTKYLCTVNATSGSYVGVSLAQHSSGYTQVTAVRTLTQVSGVAGSAFYQSGDNWYVEANGMDLPVSGQVQIYISSANMWLTGSDGLITLLAGDYSLTVYYDRAASSGGQVRVIVAS